LPTTTTTTTTIIGATTITIITIITIIITTERPLRSLVGVRGGMTPANAVDGRSPVSRIVPTTERALGAAGPTERRRTADERE
jgi:hypothetical protein